MYLSAQGVNFLGLTAKKNPPLEDSSIALRAVQEKLESFNQVSTGFANNTVALENLKAINAQAYCVVDGQKVEICEKSWDRGGILEGKVPLEEGIASGLYHIEKPEIAEQEEMKQDLDELLAQLRAQLETDAAVVAGKKPHDPFKQENSAHKKDDKKIELGSSFKFLS